MTLDVFVQICILSHISPQDVNFGRAGPGCGVVSLQHGPIIPTCVLGSSGLRLEENDLMFRKNPVLQVLDSIITNAKEDSNVIIIVDLK